jgi:hypothetical protein
MMDDGIFGILVVEANPHFSRRDMQLLNVHYLLLLNVFFFVIRHASLWTFNKIITDD